MTGKKTENDKTKPAPTQDLGEDTDCDDSEEESEKKEDSKVPSPEQKKDLNEDPYSEDCDGATTGDEVDQEKSSRTTKQATDSRKTKSSDADQQ